MIRTRKMKWPGARKAWGIPPDSGTIKVRYVRRAADGSLRGPYAYHVYSTGGKYHYVYLGACTKRGMPRRINGTPA